MKKVLAILVMLTTPALAADPLPMPLSFSGPSVVYPVQEEITVANNNPVRMGTRLPSPYGQPQTPSTWYTVDLKPYGVPADADSVELSGLLIITHGGMVETADMHVAFRKFGSSVDPNCVNYIGQVVETDAAGGQRSNNAVRVPLEDGKLQYCYWIPSGYAWPTGSSYGVNFSIMSYSRPLSTVLTELGLYTP